MITAVIVDDEKHSRATLSWKLEKFCPDVSVVAQFSDPMDALHYLKNTPPELLFLDIEMPRLNGFELLEELDQPLSFHVVFTTAYDEFGIKAIKANALDYLLKPIQNGELKSAIDKFKSTYKKESKREIKKEESGGKIALATKESIEFVAPEEIIMCKSDSNYTMVHLTGKRKKLISKTLKEVEVWMKPYNFFRAHLSYLVNLDHIKEYVRADGGYLIVSEGHSLPVARNRKDDLMKLI